MDNVTHGLAGYCLYKLTAPPERTISGKVEKWMLAATVLASELPDADMISAIYGTGVNLLWHRTYTHSLPGLVILALTITLSFKAICPSLEGKRLLSLTLAAGLLHSTLDLMTSYGTKVLLPWSRLPYAWDILPIVDPYLLVMLGLFLWLGHKSNPRRHLVFLLVIMLGYLSFRVYVHYDIAKDLRNSFPHAGTVLATPPIGSLTEWRYMVETPDGFRGGKVTWRGGVSEDIFVPDVSFNPAVRTAADSETGRIMRSWARYLAYQVREEGAFWHVLIFDPRYAAPGRIMFVGHVWLDEQFAVMHEEIRSR
ncbi:MAG: metal-dependent hydrolase [Negativicutes bacterium]|nr:metal-dependent hydrolase [Negativicutes bacterium]